MGTHNQLYRIPLCLELNLKLVTGFSGPTEFHAVADPKLFARAHHGKGIERKVQATDK